MCSRRDHCAVEFGGIDGWEPVRAALNQLEGILTAEVPQIEDVDKEVFAVPAIDGNVVEALLDVERRRWFNELDPNTRLKYSRDLTRRGAAARTGA